VYDKLGPIIQHHEIVPIHVQIDIREQVVLHHHQTHVQLRQVLQIYEQQQREHQRVYDKPGYIVQLHEIVPIHVLIDTHEQIVLHH